MPFNYAEQKAADVLRAYHATDPSGAHQAIAAVVREVLDDAAREVGRVYVGSGRLPHCYGCPPHPLRSHENERAVPAVPTIRQLR